ncbi:MAG: hypothetical protein BMS9Abin37_0585 [Acidobacteriota bacterium]|nr:MAG: hypothetical protein BMS9Abin37_0585 [Acidobacteriota bacterium]
MRGLWSEKLIGVLVLVILVSTLSGADTLDNDDSWADIASDEKSLVFGKFVGKFNSSYFRSRKVRLREVTTGKVEVLEIGDALGYIAETIPPGVYDMLGFEAIYYPPTTHPMDPRRYRPIRQRFAVNPKAGESMTSRILVTKNRPVYIGTIRADNLPDGIVYRGHQLRIIDDFEESYQRLSSSYPTLVGSLERQGIVPARHFMLKPTRVPGPLERVIGLDDPIKQAREYISDGKYRQAITWLDTFMPASDDDRTSAKLLAGEALLGDQHYEDAIEELGDVLLIDPNNTRALRLLARAHALDGNLEDAQNLYEGLAQLVPGDAEAHLHLGYLYALQDERERSREQFGAAFTKDFDYLLHDFAPFLIALREALAEADCEYLPPRVVRYSVPPPKNMDSRRSSANSGFSVLIDHRGHVIAAQLGARSRGSAPMMMLSLVKATYEPASLNGIPIPALFIMGESGVPLQ